MTLSSEKNEIDTIKLEEVMCGYSAYEHWCGLETVNTPLDQPEFEKLHEEMAFAKYWVVNGCDEYKSIGASFGGLRGRCFPLHTFKEEVLKKFGGVDGANKARLDHCINYKADTKEVMCTTPRNYPEEVQAMLKPIRQSFEL